MAEEKKVAVRNAADEEQVAKAGERDKERRFRELNDLQWVLSDRKGRRVLWRLMEQCGTFATCWNPSSAEMGRRAANQEIGHWVRKEMTEANKDAFMQMMHENLKENANA